MGVFQRVVKLLYHSLLFLIRLPRPVFSFMAWIFIPVTRPGTAVKQDETVGQSRRYLKDCDEEYDSTWEDEESDHEETRVGRRSRWNTYAARDMQNFRQKFRETQEMTDAQIEDDEELPNLHFYQNKIRFEPDGVNIEDFHKYYFGDYERLEHVHSYIQWLFPIQEKGMNFESRELSLKEIKLFHEDEEVKKRLLISYKLMLDFYGIELENEQTGKVKRVENEKKLKQRFANLNRNTHNNLRITRILKSLALLGFSHYQAPLVRFFLEETLVNGTLSQVKQSVLDYFMFAVVDKSERKDLIKFAFHQFKPNCDKFVWCPRKIHNKLLNETKKPSDGTSSQNDTFSRNNEIKSDTTESTNNEKSLTSKSENDQNVSGEHQKPDLPVSTDGNAKRDTSDGPEALSGVDSQHKDSQDEAAIQKDEGMAKNIIPNSVQKATEKNTKMILKKKVTLTLFHNKYPCIHSTYKHSCIHTQNAGMFKG